MPNMPNLVKHSVIQVILEFQFTVFAILFRFAIVTLSLIFAFVAHIKSRMHLFVQCEMPCADYL